MRPRFFSWQKYLIFFLIFCVGNLPDAVLASYNISTITSASKSFLFSSQSTNPNGVAFSADGTKMYMASFAGTVYQYTLGTAWDVSTASYASKSANLSAQGSGIDEIFLSDDGATLLVLQFYVRTIYQYTLGTPYDISTASYASKSFTISQGQNDYSMYVKSGGLKFYVMSDYDNKIFQYTMSSAWDISTASYDSVSVTIPTFSDGQRLAMTISPNGENVYIQTATNERIHWLVMSTPWTISSATYQSTYYTFSGVDSSIRVMNISPDGSYIYITGTATYKVYQYNLNPADSTAPTTPGIPTASTAATDNTPTITWTASTDETALASTPYYLQWGTASDFSGTVYSSSTATNSFTATSTLADGSWYYRVRASDATGNTSSYATSSAITIDTTAPTLAIVSGIAGTTGTNTPSLTISSTEAGTITYGGSCTSATTSAIAGNTTITLRTLSDGTYSNCTVTVTDSSGNASSALSIGTFTITSTRQISLAPTPTYTITLTSPIQESTWYTGETHTIGWNVSSNTGFSVALHYAPEGSEQWSSIVDNYVVPNGYDWLVPIMHAGNIVLRASIRNSAGTLVQSSLSPVIRVETIQQKPEQPEPTRPPAITQTPEPDSTIPLVVPPETVSTPSIPVPLTPPSGPLPEEQIRVGTRGPGVVILCTFLAENGFGDATSCGDVFTPEMELSLVQFQKTYTENGMVGIGTIAFLNALLDHPPMGECRTSHFFLRPPRKSFTRVLQFGDEGDDVLVLQQFLNENGFLLGTSGPGSPGAETEYFAKRTQSAVQLFQNTFGLVSEQGSAGAKNRFFINSLLVDPPKSSCPTLRPPTKPFLKNLFLGDRGESVKMLQQFLQTNDFLPNLASYGIAAKETNYFGPYTRAALTRFQIAFDLFSEKNILGKKTRAYINALFPVEER